MAILSLPSTPRFQTARFRLQTHTLTHVSELDRTAQTVEIPEAARWSFEATLPPMNESTAAAWIAKLAELGGQAGRFYQGDPWKIAPLGTAKDTPGTPQVAGASQTGKTLDIDGAPASETGWLLAGDYIAYDLPSGGRALHILTADADTDGSGAATLSFYPAIRESPADNETIRLSPATCVMRLIDDEQAAWDVTTAGLYRISIAAIETFTT